MSYDYLSINFTAVSGSLFLLIFLLANASLDRKIKRIFYLLLLLEFIEMAAYSLELVTTTFAALSPARLWLSAIGYSIRPFIFCLILMLATRQTTVKQFPKAFYFPALVNTAAAFSVFFTDVVYSYTPDNLFRRGPLGFFTHIIIILYLFLLVAVVMRVHGDRPKLEILIIFAIVLLLFFSMAIEAAFSIRTIGRSAIVLVTIFYYMFFQTQVYTASLSREQSIRQKLEHTSRIDGSTGVLNKRAFTEAAKSILAKKSPKQPSSIGFIFLDMDHLKKLNDTLGHAMGDIAIEDTVQKIRTVYRDTDLIGRFGGDEFYILLHDISKKRLYESLDAVQESLRRTYAADGVSVTVTVSIGAVYTENVDELAYENLVHAADDALYKAKQAGRDCHVVREL